MHDPEFEAFAKAVQSDPEARRRRDRWADLTREYDARYDDGERSDALNDLGNAVDMAWEGLAAHMGVRHEIHIND